MFSFTWSLDHERSLMLIVNRIWPRVVTAEIKLCDTAPRGLDTTGLRPSGTRRDLKCDPSAFARSSSAMPADLVQLFAFAAVPGLLSDGSAILCGMSPLAGPPGRLS
jgi:hypothetical protein